MAGELLKSIKGAGAGPVIQGILGGAQLFGGLINQAKGRKEVKNLLANRPTAEEDTGIMSYYNQALQRAGVSPTQTSMYKRQMQNIGRGAATGLRAAQDRRGGLAAASSISRGMSDSALAAETAAEGQQERRFGQLGSAAQMAAGERRRVFDINKMQPFQTKLSMAAQRAAGGAQTANIGLSNIFGAGSTISQSDLYKQIYGDEGGSSNSVIAGKIGRSLGKRAGRSLLDMGAI